jgi:signal transduction histidine kinase/CheY-like chemotaxis protein
MVDVKPNQMQLHRLTLEFSGTQAYLEPQFQADYFRKSLRLVRIMLLLGAMLYSAFLILDMIMLPDHKYITGSIRLAVVCFVFLIYFSTFHPRFQSLMQPLFALLTLVAGGAIIFMIAIIPTPVNNYYYAGLILIFIFEYTLIRLRFIWATVVGWIQVALYLIVTVCWIDAPASIIINNNFFYISASLSCMIACYSMEYYARRDFFLAHMLTQEREKVQRMNDDLEIKIQGRTAQLQDTNRNLQREMTERQLAEDERTKLQVQLKQAESMETIGKLAAGVAHDLNNILSGVVSYPEIILLELPADNPLREDIKTIQRSGQRAAAVVQDLLALARQGVIVKIVIDINAVAREYLDSPELAVLKSSFPHIRIDTTFQDGPLKMIGSSVHIMKLIMNIVTNAAEAINKEGSISITTESIYIDKGLAVYEQIPQGEYVVLGIADTGTGISQEDLHKIFEPFYTKKEMGRRSGTGLGMTLAYSTVKDHNGFIDLFSKEGEGTIIKFYFPATREDILLEVTPPTLMDLRGTEKILVIDDIYEQRDIASKMLQKLGYNVHTVESGEAAVDYLARENADLLVLDMIMSPGIDGCETYRRIIETLPGQKAVISSGFSESEQVKEAQRLGAGMYIKKPYTLEKLAMTVRRELDRH